MTWSQERAIEGYRCLTDSHLSLSLYMCSTKAHFEKETAKESASHM